MSYEVIAIGASWGGLHAVGTLLEGIPPQLDQAIVIAQHRSAESTRGMLESLLQRHIGRPVSEPGDKQPVEPRHVYVAPADYHLLVDGRRFALSVDARVQFAGPRSTSSSSRSRRRTATARSGSCSRARTRTAPPGWRRSSATAASRSSRTRGRRSDEVDAGGRDRGAQADAVLPLEEIGPFLYGLCCRVSDRAKLLLVDDRPENLLALEAILEPLGQELVRAGSGEEALRHLLHEEFAAILLDVQMPGMDGFQTAELIKQRERTRHVPIIFLTAISKDAEHVFRGYDAGAVDYLMKPFDPQDPAGEGRASSSSSGRRRSRSGGRTRCSRSRRSPRSSGRARSGTDPSPTPCRRSSGRPTPDGKVVFYNERWYEYTGMTPRRRGEPADRRPPRGLPATDERWEQLASKRRAVRDRVPAAARRRVVPLASRPLGLPARRERRRDRLGRVGDRHRGPQARRGPAELPRRGRLGARQLARLRADPHRRRAARGAADRRLVRRRHLRRRPARAAGARARRPAQGRARPGAAGADAGRGAAAGAAAIRTARRCSSARSTTRRSRRSASTSASSRSPARSRRARTSASRSWPAARSSGAISLVTAESGRGYGEDDLTLAQELARHAAAAIDNARLYAEAERAAARRARSKPSATASSSSTATA